MQIPRLDGRTILITGGTSGIGMEAAVDLATAGAQVVVTGRDRAKGERVVQEIRTRSGSTKVDLLVGNFESQKATRELAAEFLAKYPKLHVLINNAGTVYARRELTEDGIEKTFAVNHLGYFLFTNLLLDRIIESAPARIVNVSSVGHKRGTLDFEDLSFERSGYTTMKGYTRSKLGNVLFTTELARRLAGKGVTVNTLHPGAVATNIWSHAPAFARPVLALLKLFFLTPKQGSETITWLAASPAVEGVTGKYFVSCQEATPSALSQDEGIARKLWDVSARLTGMLHPSGTAT
jgi:NAD(P)-dependent dehydrogenase (short-subunit alcohol dehydrogenase family)